MVVGIAAALIADTGWYSRAENKAFRVWAPCARCRFRRIRASARPSPFFSASCDVDALRQVRSWIRGGGDCAAGAMRLRYDFSSCSTPSAPDSGRSGRRPGYSSAMRSPASGKPSALGQYGLMLVLPVSWSGSRSNGAPAHVHQTVAHGPRVGRRVTHAPGRKQSKRHRRRSFDRLSRRRPDAFRRTDSRYPEDRGKLRRRSGRRRGRRLLRVSQRGHGGQGCADAQESRIRSHPPAARRDRRLD